MDDLGVGDRIPAGKRDVSLLHRVQIGSKAHPSSYEMGSGCRFPKNERPERETNHSPIYSTAVKIHSLMNLQGVVLIN
jgi:hypothetical protein